MLLAATAASAVWLLWALPLPLILLWFVVWFFRDPERASDAPPNAILAPADGVIVQISEADEPENIGGRARRIAIFMSVFNVHVNRAPCNGKIKWLRHKSGKFFNAMGDNAGIENEQEVVAIDSDGRLVTLKLIAGLIARRIVCPLKPGDPVERGKRIGMIKFGSRVEVFVPASASFQIAVKIGQKVTAGKTVIGLWQ